MVEHAFRHREDQKVKQHPRRRMVQWLGGAFALLLGLTQFSQAQTSTHGLALVGTPALPADFPYFPYVNPDAPKGGTVVTAAIGSFDSFNPFILRGTPAAAAGRVFETMLVTSADEPATGYCHLCRSVEVAPDHLSVAFNLRPDARFQDGHPLTSEDVVWTFETLLKDGRPNFRQYYSDVASVAAEGPQRVVYRFKTAENRELPQIVGEMPVLPKHWWAGRDFTKPLTEAPLGSGPYRIASFEMGRTVTLERVKDYWGARLPTARGLNHFDVIRTEYYRDSTVALEAFKAGQIDWRSENIAKNWATAYDFPAVQKGLVRKLSFPTHIPAGMQAFGMNTRRAIFSNRLVRAAMIQAFDFEWMNRNLFFGSYVRSSSYFTDSDFASSGLPEGDEKALLEKYRALVPPEVFSTPYTLPVTDGSGGNRAQLKAALDLLQQAGWKVIDRKLVDASGKQFTFEILLNQPAFERVALPYAQNLEKLGIKVNVRTVDPAQYERLMDTFDFDMTVVALGQSDSPGNEQRDYWSCEAAKAEGGSNYMGVCDKAVQALVDTVVAAQTRPQLIAATRALDRVLLWGDYVVPQWHLAELRIAAWDRFGIPDRKVRTGTDINTWWVDPAKAAVVDAARHGQN